MLSTLFVHAKSNHCWPSAYCYHTAAVSDMLYETFFTATQVGFFPASFCFWSLLGKHHPFHHDKSREETAAVHTDHNTKRDVWVFFSFSTDGHSWDTESAPSVTHKSFRLGQGPASRLFMSGFLIGQLDVCVALIRAVMLDPVGGCS